MVHVIHSVLSSQRRESVAFATLSFEERLQESGYSYRVTSEEFQAAVIILLPPLTKAPADENYIAQVTGYENSMIQRVASRLRSAGFWTGSSSNYRIFPSQFFRVLAIALHHPKRQDRVFAKLEDPAARILWVLADVKVSLLVNDLEALMEGTIHSLGSHCKGLLANQFVQPMSGLRDYIGISELGLKSLKQSLESVGLLSEYARLIAGKRTTQESSFGSPEQATHSESQTATSIEMRRSQDQGESAPQLLTSVTDIRETTSAASDA